MLKRVSIGMNPEHYFILHDGRVIKSLEELMVVIKTIDKKLFEYHANQSKNDFANWIKYVFKAGVLAETISDYTYSDRHKFIASIKKHISEKKILIINAGSSTLKFQVIELVSKDILIRGVIDAINSDRCSLKITTNHSEDLRKVMVHNHEEALLLALKTLTDNEIVGDILDIKAVAHRVVHGGEYYRDAVLIDAEVISKLQELCSIAPLHNPHNIACIQACQKHIPCPQVAVFDTAFHSTIPKEKYLYGLPFDYYEKYGIRKFGFHGTSHKYIAKLVQEYYKVKKKDAQRIIICHLGNGCSITAVRNGKSFNTTMGFSPTDGLIMGTRTGSIDPFLVVHLQKSLGLNNGDLSKLLNKESGLLGISGYSDMRDIWKNHKDDNCSLAMDMFCDRITHYIGAYVAELNGVDAIVFTAGIGENAFYVRKKVLENFRFLGLKLDDKKNEQNEFIITTKDSKIECLVIATNEELQMAMEAKKLLKI